MNEAKRRERKENKMKTIKTTTIILGIILITMISIIGIYTQKANQMKNNIKEYTYAMDLKGERNIKLSVSTETEEVIKDSEGNIVKEATEEEIEQKGYKKEQIAKNGQDILTVENYKKTKERIEKRLKKLGVENYIVSVNEENGEILVKIPEDKITDTIVSNINTIGKLEIIDTETKEVLINNEDVKTSSVMYNNTQNGTAVYLEIAFNKEGKKKLEEISKTYVKTENINNTENNTTAENATEESTENKVENSTTESKTNETSTEEVKQITMKIDDTEIMTTSFDNPITTGKIQLSVGTIATDNNKLQEYISQAREIATILDSGNLPIKYDISKNEYILSSIEKQDITKIIIIVAIVAVIGIIALIVKYKSNGLLAGISYVGLVAIYMLLIRYANVAISIESIFGIISILVLNYIFVKVLLSNIDKIKEEKIENKVNKATSKTYSKFFIRIIPICIMTVVFCFIKWIPISSFGMIAFWGLLLIAIYNLVITRTLLKIQLEEK